VGEQASEIVHRRATLARVCGRSGFWEAYSRLLASSARSALIRFLAVGTVQETALLASTAYDYIEHSDEISHVNGATDALSIDPSAGYILLLVIVHVLLLFTAYVSIHAHMHIHVVTYITLVF
jgi:hypothetical protein